MSDDSLVNDFSFAVQAFLFKVLYFLYKVVFFIAIIILCYLILIVLAYILSKFTGYDFVKLLTFGSINSFEDKVKFRLVKLFMGIVACLAVVFSSRLIEIVYMFLSIINQFFKIG